MGNKTVFTQASSERKDLDVLQVLIDLGPNFRAPAGPQVDVTIECSGGPPPTEGRCRGRSATLPTPGQLTNPLLTTQLPFHQPVTSEERGGVASLPREGGSQPWL